MENVHAGSCHCGKVRWEARADIRSVVSCNCSICMRTGSLLAFVPAENFTLHTGDDALTDYQFNQHVIHHLFCSTCGIRSFARGVAPDGKPMVVLNVRCIEGIELDGLDVQHYDGRSA